MVMMSLCKFLLAHSQFMVDEDEDTDMHTEEERESVGRTCRRGRDEPPAGRRGGASVAVAAVVVRTGER